MTTGHEGITLHVYGRDDYEALIRDLRRQLATAREKADLADEAVDLINSLKPDHNKCLEWFHKYEALSKSRSLEPLPEEGTKT